MGAPDPPVTELSSTTQDLGLEDPPAHLSSSLLLKLGSPPSPAGSRGPYTAPTPGNNSPNLPSLSCAQSPPCCDSEKCSFQSFQDPPSPSHTADQQPLIILIFPL